MMWDSNEIKKVNLLVNSSYMKSLISTFIEVSKELENKVNHNSLKKVVFIKKEMMALGTSSKYIYNDFYRINLSDITVKKELLGVAFYEFNISGFIYVIVRIQNEFYIINYRNGVVRLVNGYYIVGVGRQLITSRKVFDELLIDSAVELVDDVNKVSDELYSKSVLSIVYDIENDSDLLFTYLENSYVNIDEDLMNPNIGGKTGLFVSSKLIHTDFSANMAKYGFLDTI